MLEFNRKDFIKYAVENKLPQEQINNVLIGEGVEPLTEYENRLITKDRYDKNILQRVGGDAVNIGKGISTILSAVPNYVTNSDFRQYINEKLSNITPAKVGELLTENYNYDPAMFRVDPGLAIEKLGAGIGAEPGLALLDVAPVIGAGVKGVSKGVKAVTKATKGASNVADTVKTLGKIEVPINTAVNEILNVSREAPIKGVNEAVKIYSDINAKYSLDDIQRATKNLEEGTREGSKTVLNATEEMKKFSDQVNKLMQELGVSPTKAQEVAVAQKVSRDLLKDTGLKINVDDINKALDGNQSSIARLQKKGIDVETFATYYNDAQELWDRGLLSPLRHSTRDVEKWGKGINTPEDFAKGVLAERRYGTQSYENLAKGFKEGGYNPLLEELESSKQVTSALDEIINSVGKKVTPDTLPTLGKDEVYVSKQFINDVIGQTLEAGGKTKDAVRNALRSFSDSIDNLPPDDIYILRKKDVNALENAFVSDKNLKSNGWYNNLSSIGKQNALATLRYIAGNTMANVTSNFATGVTPLHYAKAIKAGAEGIPEALRRSSSYQGYLGRDLDVNKSLKGLYSDLWKEFTGKDTSMTSRLKVAQSMANLPIFRTASKLETLDRSANFFKNAERVAKEVGKTTDEIVAEAKANGGNNQVYREIKRRIDNDLGDYVGHNYYIDPRVEETARLFIPFYRPYTQGTRVFGNIATNYPAFYQTHLKLPSLIGNEFTRQGAENGVEPDKEYGGFPIWRKYGNMPSKVMINPYHNATAMSEMIQGAISGNPEMLPTANTFAIAPILSLMGLNKYGSQATPPGTYNVNGKQITVDNNGNPLVAEGTVLDRIQLFLAQTGQTYAPGVNTINQSILPFLATIAGKDYRTPSDYSIFGQIGDTTIPLLSQGGKNARVTIEEKLLPTIGFNYKQTYKENKQLKLSDIKALRRKQYIEQLRNRR